MTLKSGPVADRTGEQAQPRPTANPIKRLLASQRVLMLGVLIALLVVFGALAPSSFISAFFSPISSRLQPSCSSSLLERPSCSSRLESIFPSDPFSCLRGHRSEDHGESGGAGAAWDGVVLGWSQVSSSEPPGERSTDSSWRGGRFPRLVVTLGTFGASLGVAEVITGGNDISNVPNHLIDVFGVGSLAGIPVFVWIAAVLVALATILLNMTTFGRHALAIGANPEAARRSGIRVERHLLKVYALAGALAGVAGLLSLARFSNTTIAGHAEDNLSAITAVVVGGTSLFGGYGTMIGTVIGTFIPVVLLNGLVILNINSFWQQVVVGAVLIIAVYIDQRRRLRFAN